MTERPLLDTHIALRLDSGEGASAMTRAPRSIAAGRAAARSILPAEDGLDRFLDRPGIAAVPLDCRAACRAYRLDRLEHRDPADRLLIATAIELGCPFVTYDTRIVVFARRHGRRSGFAVSAR